MSRKIVVVQAGPRKGWNTDTLVRDAAAGAEEAGAELQCFDLFDLEPYTGCVSCFGCKTLKHKGHCVRRDGLTPVLDAIREAEDDWKHLTPAEREKCDRFEVSKIAVSLNPSFDGPFSWYEEEDGWIESNIYECAKDYLK